MEAASWRVEAIYHDYAEGYSAYTKLAMTDHHSVLFQALDEDGNPLVTPEDMARMEDLS